MKVSHLLTALLVPSLLATPALAFQVEVHGDFKNRLMYSNQADLGAVFSEPGIQYVNVTAEQIKKLIGLYSTDKIEFPLDTHKKSGDSDFFGEVKYRLTFDATDDDKKVKGVLGFEFGSSKFGAPGSDKGAPFGGDQNTFEFRWGYVDFEVPFCPDSRLSVGLMPVGYNAYFWNDNAAGVKWSVKRDNLEYSLGWWRNDVTDKGLGGPKRETNDDVYVADAGYRWAPDHRINGFASYGEFGQEELFSPDFTEVVVDQAMDKIWWLGLAGEGQIGAFFYGATGIYQTGSIDAASGMVFAPGVHDSLDREAFLINAEGTYALDRGRVTVGYLYASGDDDPTDDKVENYHSLEAYLENIGSQVFSSYWADDNYMVGSNYFLDRGFNVPYISATFNLTDKLTAGGGYYYWNTAEDVIDNKDLGHEFNARLEYAVTKNLSTGINVGYLIGGDAWDDMASNGDGDDLIRSEASVRLTF